MKKTLLATLLILGCAFSAQAQLPSTDAYGGRTDINCADQTKSYFHLEKITVAGKPQWFFCTAVTTASGVIPANPVSHPFDAMSVGDIGPSFITSPDYDPANRNAFGVIAAKYAITGDTGGTNYNWTWQNELRLKHIFFNTIGQDNSSQTGPYNTCTFGSNGCNWTTGKNPDPMPILLEARPFQGSLSNDIGLFTSPPKDIISGTNTNWTGYRGGTIPDTFDTQIYTEFHDLIIRSDPADAAINTSSPWVLGVLTDDSDWYECSGAGSDFLSLGAKTQIRCAWAVLITSPVQTYTPHTTSGSGSTVAAYKRFIYTSPNVLSKMQALNPVTTCSVANPCSLRDYLWQKYGASIASLNTAWGSNYTTFDSTGTQITNEQPTGWTGNGTQTVFSGTLVNHPISPLSVLVSVGGVATIGGCPWFYNTSGSTPGNNTFCKEGGPNLAVNTGTLGTVTFPSLESANATAASWSSGTATYTFPTPLSPTAMVGQQFTASGFAPSGYNVTGSITAVNAAAGTISVAMASNPGAVTSKGTGAINYIDQINSTINFSTGAISITFTTAPANGAAITVSYISGGWMAGGTGLMDESGGTGSKAGCPGSSSTCWVGTNPKCLEPATTGYTTYFACTATGGDSIPAPDANANLGADLDAWEAQHTAEYFKNCQSTLRAVSNVPYLGLDTVGAWGTGPYRRFIEGEVPYVDGLFLDTELQYSSQGAPEFSSQYQYITQYAGDKPFMAYFDITSQPTSSLFSLPSGSSVDMASTPARATAYYNTLNFLYSTLSFNNDIQVVGSAWWSFAIATGAESGLIDLHDNMYDGVEDASGAVPCDSYYTSNTTCGGEVTLSIIPHWTSGLTVQHGSCVQPSTSNSHAYCNQGGAHATGTTEPTWCVTSGCTVVDNTMTLTETAVPATPLGDMMGGSTGMIAANQLWMTGAAPPPPPSSFPIAPSKKSIIWGLASQGTEDKDAPSGAIRR